MQHCFNPRPRAGGDADSLQSPRTDTCFNPRPRAGGDTRKLADMARSVMFQSTPPRGGRRFVSMIRLSDAVRFNPRPRAGGDAVDTGACYWQTAGFNPRPRAGGDSAYLASAYSMTLFQSTPPRGGRPANSPIGRTCSIVSIHAPARGATSMVATVVHGSACFNPRPRAGGDLS